MKLAYRETGTGQALIILHGLFGQSDNWNTLAKNFAEAGFRLLTVDQRNHGLSPHSSEWDYSVMARDIKELIDDLGLQKPILMGHSMGGKTALFFEKLFPDVLDKLIVADIAPRVYAPHHQSVLAALNAVNFKAISTRKEAEAVLSKYISDFGTKQFLLKNIYWKDAESSEMAWRFNLEVITQKYDNIGVAVPEFVSAVKTLVIRGGKSDYVTEDDLLHFRHYFPNLSVVTVSDAGHWVHAEKPKEFFEAVLGFIKA